MMNHFHEIVSNLIHHKSSINTPEMLKPVNRFVEYSTRKGQYINCILSENDLIANTLHHYLKINDLHNGYCSEGEFTYRIIPNANHTFTTFEAKNCMFNYTLTAIQQMISSINNCKISRHKEELQ
jgi:hypothetical protein